MSFTQFTFYLYATFRESSQRNISLRQQVREVYQMRNYFRSGVSLISTSRVAFAYHGRGLKAHSLFRRLDLMPPWVATHVQQAFIMSIDDLQALGSDWVQLTAWLRRVKCPLPLSVVAWLKISYIIPVSLWWRTVNHRSGKSNLSNWDVEQNVKSICFCPRWQARGNRSCIRCFLSQISHIQPKNKISREILKVCRNDLRETNSITPIADILPTVVNAFQDVSRLRLVYAPLVKARSTARYSHLTRELISLVEKVQGKFERFSFLLHFLLYSAM